MNQLKLLITTIFIIFLFMSLKIVLLTWSIVMTLAIPIFIIFGLIAVYIWEQFNYPK